MQTAHSELAKGANEVAEISGINAFGSVNIGGIGLLNTLYLLQDSYRSEFMRQSHGLEPDFDSSFEPKTELGAIALAYAVDIFTNKANILDDLACGSAEFRFLQSIDQLEHGVIHPTDKRLARIYLNSQGTPIVFTKHRGTASSLVIDYDELIPGLIPGDIVSFKTAATYFRQPNPSNVKAGLELVPVPSNDTVFLSHIRPSVFAFSEKYRSLLNYTPPVYQSELSFSRYGTEIEKTEMIDIQERIAQLVADAISEVERTSSF